MKPVLWKKLFDPVKALEPEDVKDFISRHLEGTYALIDVRQPGEYEKEHLPGAQLIPLPNLTNSLTKLDPEKPTIVY
jgi:sulfur-carrier protein adenylyltransferase/sulfurtransferase